MRRRTSRRQRNEPGENRKLWGVKRALALITKTQYARHWCERDQIGLVRILV